MEAKRYTKEQITNIASDILKAYGSDGYPIMVVDLAKKIGLEIYNADFDRDDVAGMIKADERKIYICKTDRLERQRFSIAHEIGHYVLHYRGNMFDSEDAKKHISFRNSLSSLGFSIKEIEANFFAANILMPKDEVLRLCKENYSLSSMADYFVVSKSAMAYRLDFLGIDYE